MTLTTSLLAYLAAASLLTITPGVDTAMVLRSAAVGGASTAWAAAFGIGLGCLAWGVLVAFGLGALLAASPLAFEVLTMAGAGYLVVLGARLILHPRSKGLADGEGSGADRVATLRRGFLTNMLNPKVGVFYLTFLPQFVPAGVNVAGYSVLLAAIHVLLGLAWCGVLVAATVPMQRLLRRPDVVRWLDRATGGLFIAFGLRLALSRG
jgi:threonine/homoserine/homoserine lactone efflux protein